MIKVYESHEIPKGYQDTIIMNNIKLNNVKYVINADCNSRSWKVAASLGNYKSLGTITDDWIYVILNE